MSVPAVNSVAWFEIGTDRPSEVKEFYGQMFGWTSSLNTNLPGVNYHAVVTPAAPQPTGGVWESDGKFANYAIFYVLVQDVAASVERAEELGGKAKEALGDATDNERLEREGRGEQTEANLKQAGDKVNDAFNS